MVTGYEVEYYHNVKRIADALERVAQALEANTETALSDAYAAGRQAERSERRE